MNSKTLLIKHFGFRDFRPGQKDIVQSILQGRDVLALMRTGGGKSICFQVPAMGMQGTCLVISPLISLMRDQVNGLKKHGIQAECINSQMDSRERACVQRRLLAGEIKFLYVAPERILSEDFFDMLKQISISFIVVDEAHVITEWGDGFRPSYVLAMEKLNELEKIIGLNRNDTSYRLQKCAFSASIIEEARDVIAERVGLVREKRFITSFERKNISLSVVPYSKDRASKLTQLISSLNEAPAASTIIYAGYRRECENLSERLSVRGFEAAYYHAGMPKEKRNAAMASFMSGQTKIIVCTSAFGMGIDKKNVRRVFHWSLPSSLEDMYQEMGRAGRDGDQSTHIVFYSEFEVRRAGDVVRDTYPESDALRKLYMFIRIFSNKNQTTIIEEDAQFLSDIIGSPVTKGNIPDLFNHLSRSGYLQLIPSSSANANQNNKKQRVFEIVQDNNVPNFEHVQRLAEAARVKFDKLQTYLKLQSCRNYFLLEYLGEPGLSNHPTQCTHCDNCKNLAEDKTSLLTIEKVNVAKPPDPTNQSTVKRLTGLRDAYARKHKIPANRVMSSTTISNIANASPSTEQELRAIGVSDIAIKYLGRTVLKIIEEQRLI